MSYPIQFCFADKIKAYEKIWIISDDFGYQSYEVYFTKQSAEGYYTKDNFDMTGFVSSRFNTNPSAIGRFRNGLVKGIEDQIQLPKYVVIVPDDDIIKMFRHTTKGLSKAFGRVIEKMMTDFDKIIEIHKDHLPSKAKKQGYPRFVWIEPPMHEGFENNHERFKFNKVLERMADVHENTVAVQLKKIWDGNDSSLFIQESNRFTSLGYTTYWKAIDSTIRYCDTILFKKHTFGKPKGNYKQKFDRYHWPQHSTVQNIKKIESDTGRRKLPTPPRKLKQ